MFLGRIEEIKGTHIAIEVAKKSKRKLIIAGNIPAGKEEYFNKMINPHLGDQIIYVGPVNDAQKNELLGKSAALLMPILWNEPFGIVMAESMACGTPILGFNMGSVPEIVINGVNGFICKNIEEMVSCVAECNLLDRKEIRSITERQFSNKKIINDYISLYQKLIDRKNHQ
jgi:glycosyltransferase involved in cell wall biosynthesis